MKETKFGILSLLLLISCSSATTLNKQMSCGYELTEQEYAQLKNKAGMQGSAYEADSLWHIFDQLHDSIRSAMPDTVEFEIFPTLLNNNEVGIDVIVPNNEAYFDKIACAVMNSKYTSKMPEQRYMFLYTYTNSDGSGDTPLKVAIKRKK